MESVKNKVIQEGNKGNIVVIVDELMIAYKLSEFIKQPTDGILWDLNRGEATVLTFIDDPKWINDYAACKVIRALKERISELEAVSVKVEMTKEQDMEEFFLSCLTGCDQIKDEGYPDDIFFKKDGIVYFEQDSEYEVFWCSYDKVWSVFEKRFGLSYVEIQSFVKGMVEKHLKLEGLTPISGGYCNTSRWKSI